MSDRSHVLLSGYFRMNVFFPMDSRFGKELARKMESAAEFSFKELPAIPIDSKVSFQFEEVRIVTAHLLGEKN